MFAADSARKLEVRRLGPEGEPVAVIDGLLTDPDALVEAVDPARLSLDPRVGRLTVKAFLTPTV